MRRNTAICPRSARSDPRTEVNVPSALEKLASVFPSRLYLVGGAVRDSIRGVETEDFDLAGPARPDQIKSALSGSIFKVCDSSPKLGTLIITGGGSRFEYTTFRTDSYPEGSGAHKPDAVIFTDDIELDCRRRDFCCNAVYYDVAERKSVDPLDGIADIEKKVLRTTRAPEDVFSEDGLRIMRLVRFVSTLGFAPESRTAAVAKALATRLSDVSVERIRDELDKTLAGKNVVNALELALSLGVIRQILPELAANEGLVQPARFHRYDALRHAFHTVEAARKDIKLAALLHDVGKAEAWKRDGNMHRHAEYGALQAEEITKRLKYPNAVIAETKTLVREHMYDINANAKENKLRRYVAENYAVIDKLIALVRADSKGTGLFDDCPRADRFQATLDEMKEKGIPFTVRQLAVNGDDLKKIGLKGIEIGETLAALLKECIDGRLTNDRERLLKAASKLAAGRQGRKED